MNRFSAQTKIYSVKQFPNRVTFSIRIAGKDDKAVFVPCCYFGETTLMERGKYELNGYLSAYNGKVQFVVQDLMQIGQEEEVYGE